MKKTKKAKKPDLKKDLTKAGVLMEPGDLRALKKRIKKTRAPT